MIKTILFDMGNVLVYFSHEKMCEQIAAVCGCSVQDVKRELFDSHLQWEFERGQKTEVQVQQHLETVLNCSIVLDDLKRATGDIFTSNDEMIPVLKELKQLGIRLVLLSNTCVTHLEWVQSHYPHLAYFDDITASYRAGAIKPESGIFLDAISRIECNPDECFYTDDIPEYVEAAREFGLHAGVFTDVANLKLQLGKLGLTIGEGADAG